MNRARLPKLYDSADDVAFEVDCDAETLPRRAAGAAASEADDDASGIRSFFDGLVAELEGKLSNVKVRAR